MLTLNVNIIFKPFETRKRKRLISVRRGCLVVRKVSGKYSKEVRNFWINGNNFREFNTET